MLQYGLRQHYFVNHSDNEYTRAEMCILNNVETGEVRAGIAGTQLIDSTWNKLGQHIPDTLGAPRTADALQRWTEYIRFAQWLYMVGSSDKWSAFCQAAQHFELASREERFATVSRPSKRQVSRQVSTVSRPNKRQRN